MTIAPVNFNVPVSFSSITQHPLWPQMWPYLRVSHYNPKSKNPERFRLEVIKDTPQDLLERILSIFICCPYCGNLIQPFRARTKERSPDCRAPKHVLVYGTVTCRPVIRPGCSRGKTATRAFEVVKAALQLEAALLELAKVQAAERNR